MSMFDLLGHCFARAFAEHYAENRYGAKPTLQVANFRFQIPDSRFPSLDLWLQIHMLEASGDAAGRFLDAGCAALPGLAI